MKTLGSVRPSVGSPDITGLLAAWRNGDESAEDRLFEIVYPELRQVARRELRRLRGAASLDVTEVVHELYLRLVPADAASFSSRARFFAFTARLTRSLLVDRLRRRGSVKRGGDTLQVPLDEARAPRRRQAVVEVLALDEALGALETVDRSAARVVELRYFGGMEVEEVADVLDVSKSTVTRRWRYARAWLRQRMAAQ